MEPNVTRPLPAHTSIFHGGYDTKYESGPLTQITLTRDLKSITSCELITSWDAILGDVQKYLGDNRLPCVPYISEGNIYGITSLFVKINTELKRHFYLPLGKLETFLLRDKTEPTWQELSTKVAPPRPCNYPNRFKLTVQDSKNERKIRFAANDFYRLVMLPEFSPKRNVVIDRSLSDNLSEVSFIYFINEVVYARTMELRIEAGRYSRVYYVGYPQPIVFGYQKYKLSPEGRFGKMERTHLTSYKRNAWVKKIEDEDIVPQIISAT